MAGHDGQAEDRLDDSLHLSSTERRQPIRTVERYPAPGHGDGDERMVELPRDATPAWEGRYAGPPTPYVERICSNR